MADHINSDEAITEGDELYRSLFENLLNGFAYCRMLFDDGRPVDFIYLAVNEAFKSQTGLNDVVGKKVSEVIPGILEADPQLIETYGRVAKNGKPERFEVFLEALQMWFLVSVYCPKPEHFVALFDVITERKNAEIAMQENQQRLNFLVDNSPMATVEWDSNFIVTRWAGEAENVFGWNKAETIGKTIMDLQIIYEEDIPIVQQVMAQLLNGNSNYIVSTNRNYTKNGQVIYCEWYNTVLRNLEGKLLSVLSQVLNITSRRQAEDALLKEKALLRGLIDSADDLIYFKDSNGIYLGCNKASEKFIGLTESEQIGKSDFDLLDHEIADQVQKHDKMVLQGGCSVRTEHWIPCQDGGKVFMDTAKTPIFGIDQQPIGLVGISRDITVRKQAEEELIQSNEQLKFVLEGSQLGFWDWNMETGEVVRNEQWSKMLGYTFSEIDFSTTQWTNLIHPDDRDRAWQSIKDHIEGRTPLHKAEYRMLAKDGQYRWILDQARIVKYSDEGKPLRMCGTHTDIYESKKAEEEKQILEQQLQHTQKLESLGVLSGGIAHDFNNILAIIMGYCSLTKLNYETAERNIPIIEDAAEKAAGLCRQMLAYAGKAQLTKTKINMLKNVEEIVAMLKATLPQNAVIKTDLSTVIPLIEGDANQLRQVVMNLIINASEAIGTEQGEVDVSLTRIKVIAGKEYEDYHGKPIPLGVTSHVEPGKLSRPSSGGTRGFVPSCNVRIASPEQLGTNC